MSLRQKVSVLSFEKCGKTIAYFMRTKLGNNFLALKSLSLVSHEHTEESTFTVSKTELKISGELIKEYLSDTTIRDATAGKHETWPLSSRNLWFCWGGKTNKHELHKIYIIKVYKYIELAKSNILNLLSRWMMSLGTL